MLTEITSGLWSAERTLRLPGGMRLPCRMTVVRTGSGLLVHSPISIDDPLAAEIDRCGQVTHLIAPNCMHHLWLPRAAQRYPNARIYGVPGLPGKRPDIDFHALLGNDTPLPADLAGELDAIPIHGVPRMNELVLVHRPSRTAIVGDLVFNIHEYTGWGTGMLLRMVGARKKTAQSRVWRLLTNDRAAAGASIRQLLDHDFDRVIMAHGRIIDQHGPAVIAAAAHWMLAANTES